MTDRKADGSAGDANYGFLASTYSHYRQPERAIAEVINQALAPARIEEAGVGHAV